MRTLCTDDVDEDSVTVYSDSQAALGALADRASTDQTVIGIRATIHRIGHHKSFDLRWTRAHVGTEGNEMADCLAKRGARGQGELACVPIAKRVLRSRLRAHTRRLWHVQWREYPKGRTTYGLLPEPP